ncbi:bifunctional hydroxymethylpyrimidine kinase/phosphomethylpyrimidine kinase [Vibrio salinus]|uniref:bifunctional hydroxymethylpyrimidine kinase/phosphomethylpyrimidine kinase n=1 Tax=Vibrio salinus TaxID=2899784 RepID=UPI001E607355|nr:bifunctional hydroxymethylpyrimidine kinase/phosphomethylpyrimidine kinase [Vibrio salinus]MCE0496189.1 bifunctional hydroxymethylpyrimidine kinase/phosphomethylpyrimidine kinase [Vibrio salinus]
MTSNSQQITPVTLTIAGSDSSGGAGIQADIKAMSATGSYACSAITALTSQNTQGVQNIFPVPLEHIASQLHSVFSDLNVTAVKIGMLADSEIIKLVADILRQYQPEFIVLDPVMVATSGDILLKQSAITTLIEELIPIATIITPNIPEALTLTGQSTPIDNVNINDLIRSLKKLPTRATLLKGGHLESLNESNDYLITNKETDVLSCHRVATKNTHGTGCTLSSAIASYLAQGNTLSDSVRLAKDYITQAISHADELNVGKGHGPVNHFYRPNHFAQSSHIHHSLK